MPLPEDKKFNFRRVEELYDYILDNTLFHEIREEILNTDLYKKLRHLAIDAVGVHRDNEEALLQFLATYIGRTMSMSVMDELYWRLAAGQPLLSRNIQLATAFKPTEPMWIPLRIEDVRHAPPSRQTGKPMLEVVFRIYGDIFAGMAFSQKIPYRYAMRKMARDIGLPVFRKVHKNELVQCWMVGLLDTTDPQRPRLVEFASPSTIIYHNKKLRKERHTNCVRDYKWAEACVERKLSPCVSCPIGYSNHPLAIGEVSPCPRATHSMPFVSRDCPRCNRESYFDPALKMPICLACQADEAKHLIKYASRGS